MRSPFTIHLFAFLFLLHTQQMVDKLLCGSSCKSSMGKLPLICFQKQFVLRHSNSVSLCESFHNCLEFLFARCTIVNTDTKTINQLKLLLHCIGGMQIVIIHDLQLITGFLSYQMSSVTCCIDQDIVRFLLQAALDHCLQIFIFDFKFLK